MFLLYLSILWDDCDIELYSLLSLRKNCDIQICSFSAFILMFVGEL